MGSPKPLLSITNNKNLLSLHLEHYASFCNEIRVVTGAKAEKIRPFIGKHREIYNKDWAHTEMRDSILLALEELPDTEIILLSPIDVPPAQTNALRAIISQKLPVCCGYQKKRGHPLIATKGWLYEKAVLGPLCDHITDVKVIEMDRDRTLNLNTIEQFQDWLVRFSRRKNG